MKKTLYLVSFLFTLGAQAQRMPDYGLEKVRLNEKDKTVLAEIKEVKSGPSISTDKRYYWYSGGQVRSTQGGYSGKLLNGEYREYYLNKNLKTQGRYKKGLQSGNWDYWYPDGTLKEQLSFKSGLRQGTFKEYDGKGNLSRQGKYKGDELNGKVAAFPTADSVSYSRYRDGKLVAGKPGKTGSFWKRHNPWNKKPKAEGGTFQQGNSKKEKRIKEKEQKQKEKQSKEKQSALPGLSLPGNPIPANNSHY